MFMSSTLRSTGRVVIALFVCWHIFAVGIFALPSTNDAPTAQWLRNSWMGKLVTPYIFRTSQWQQWNMFAPDPLRRVPSYAIEKQLANGQWTPIEVFSPHSSPWWTRATYFKVLMNLLEKDMGMYNETLVSRFLWRHCTSHRLAGGTRIHLVYVSYVIPSTEPKEGWRAWEPTPIRSKGLEVTCPDLAS
jgi:hypothetical protein